MKPSDGMPPNLKFDGLYRCFSSWWLNHPSEKYARQIGSFTQIGINIKKYLKPPPSSPFHFGVCIFSQPLVFQGWTTQNATSTPFTKEHPSRPARCHVANQRPFWCKDQRFFTQRPLGPNKTVVVHSLKLTASLHLKMDGWKTFSFPYGAFRPVFRGELAVSFKEGYGEGIP